MHPLDQETGGLLQQPENSQALLPSKTTARMLGALVSEEDMAMFMCVPV